MSPWSVFHAKSWGSPITFVAWSEGYKIGLAAQTVGIVPASTPPIPNQHSFRGVYPCLQRIPERKCETQIPARRHSALRLDISQNTSDIFRFLPGPLAILDLHRRRACIHAPRLQIASCHGGQPKHRSFTNIYPRADARLRADPRIRTYVH